MEWISLDTAAQIDNIKQQQGYSLIFKHSTRCSISSMAKSRLDRSEPPQNIIFYYLDLIAHRDISNRIAEEFGVHHESPQIMLIRNGKCVYDESHNGISMDDIAQQAMK